MVVEQAELIDLCEDILTDFEMSRISLSSIVYKCSRLYRLLNDDFHYTLFNYEITKYPTTITETSSKFFKEAGRIQSIFDYKTKQNQVHYIFESIPKIESIINSSTNQLNKAFDPNISIHSSNPNQFVQLPHNNSVERSILSENVRTFTEVLANIRGSLYTIVLQTYHKLRFDNTMSNIIQDHIVTINDKFLTICPHLCNNLSSIYSNLESKNPEDWANAVHSCRRILKEFSDILYPPSNKILEKNNRKIKLDEDHYINRLSTYIEEHTPSETSTAVLNSSLDQIGNRLDALYHASCKGSHAEIKLSEAKQYAIYSILFLGDILSLTESDE